MSSPQLFLIPPEVLLEALDFLDHKTLLICRQVCRHLRCTIDQTPTCQYKFDLITAGLEGGLFEDGNLTKHYEALKRYQSGWDELKWSSDSTIPAFNGSLWELYGGVLAQNSIEKSFSFTRLPAVARGIEEKTWGISKQGFQVRDFGMDPSQDLLVLIQKPTWSQANREFTHCVHLLSLEKDPGVPHPLAKGGAVLTHVQNVRSADISYTIQVSGDFVGLFVNMLHAGVNEFLIWDWKSGELKLDLTGDELQSFSFLSDRHVVLCVLCHADLNEGEFQARIEPTLVVVNFMRPSPKPQNVLELEAGAYFRYPLLHDNAGLISFEVRSDPAPGWRPGYAANVPFHLARNHRVYVITLWLQVHFGIRCLTLFVPSIALMSKVDEMEKRGVENHIMPWKDWGPTGTRMMLTNQPNSHVWVCFVYGKRYVTLESRREGDKHVWVRVHDFNDLPMRRGRLDVKRESTKTGDGAMSTLKSQEAVYEHGSTTIPEGEVFRENVETSLPFHWRSVELDIPASTPCAIMCSEDNIIIVQKSTEKYRILSF